MKMGREMLSVLVIDESRARAGEICAGLALAGYQVAAILPNSAQLTREVEKLAPDIVLIETDSPSRDTLEHLAVVHEHMPRPVIIFTQEGESETIREAIRAGVSAYVVDGLDPKRIKPVIEVARARFAEHQALLQELASSNRKLSDRKQLDRAKGVLMKARGLDEDSAYHALRKLAMERGKTMADVAQDVLDMASLFS
jgi:response regulator NasT